MRARARLGWCPGPAGPRRQPGSRCARRPDAALLVLALGLGALVTACGDDGTPASDEVRGESSTTSTTHGGHGSIGGGVGSSGTDDEGWCATPGPGVPLSAEQATVAFSTDQVCPGYVTVEPGTAVTWRNDADAEQRVVVTTGRAGDGPVVHEVDLAPGATFEQQLDPGIYTFTVSAIPAFRGTVEVLAADAGGAGAGAAS